MATKTPQLKLKNEVPKILERDTQKQIKTFLQYQGWFVVKIHQSMGSHKGIADLYALRGGVGVWIEVKTPTGRQSQDQQKFQQEVEAHGGTYILARGIDDLGGIMT